MFGCGTAYANPSIDFPKDYREYKAYIDSEKLLATISLTNVSFEGTFTFAFVQYTSDGSRTPPPTHADVSVRLWLPEIKRGNPLTERFWRGFTRHGYEYICDDPLDEMAFENSIALRVHCKNPALLPLSVPLDVASLEGRWVTDSQQGGSNRFFHCTALPRPDWMAENEGPKWGLDPGFCDLLVSFCLSAAAVTNHYPVTVSYQHPLVRSNGEARFFYIPIFNNLPSSISITDTNRYSITIRATQDCSLTVSTGEKIIIPPPTVVESGHATVDQKITVQGGQSVTLAPQHLHPIRAVSNPALATGN